MNTTLPEATELINDLIKLVNENPVDSAKIVVCPPFTHISTVHAILENTTIDIGAQNMYYEPKGAFTGEISANMLKSVGCKYVIIGHSERRQYFLEESDLLAKKVKSALENKLTPIYCCGEKLKERENNQHFEIIENQITEVLSKLTVNEINRVIIAYEPVWAIGTGLTAEPKQAQEIHAFIRHILSRYFDEAIADGISILYGGSVKASNASELFKMSDIDGGLIGGASLKPEEFMEIIKAC